MKKTLFLYLIIIGAILSSCSLTKHKEQRKYTVGKAYSTPSGLEFEFLSEGKGEKPDSGDRVTVNYVGRLTNDSVFDSSYKRDQPFKFILGAGNVIKGWDEGVALMHVGDKVKLTIPPDLGYGEKKTGPIPANSTLIFEVKLLDIESPPKPYDVKGKDTISTASGLKYIIVKSNPTGEKIEKNDLVTFDYNAYLENGHRFGSTFYNHKPIKLRAGAGHVIKGWDEALLLLRKGEKARLLIPSDLAYGEKGYKNFISPNSDLIYDVSIINVQQKKENEQ